MWTDKIAPMLNGTAGQFGVIIKNLKTKEVLFSSNENMVFPSASVIKVPILLTLMDEAAAGHIDLNEAAEAPAGGFVGGAGLYMYMSDGLPLTWRDHALFMITLSDNDSTNILISRLGMKTINAKIQELGMNSTALARKMMDFEAKKQGRDNFTTCEDMLRIFEYLNSAERYADALHILKRQQHTLLDALLDSDELVFAHKPGGLPGVRHDAGIMYLKEPIFVAFMSKETPETDCMRLAHELGLLVYENCR